MPHQLGGPTKPTIIEPTPAGPPLTFGGVVRGLLDNATPANATVRIDLAQTLPCQRESIVWQSWDAPVDAAGRFGPVTVPRPNSNDVAFYVHAIAAGTNDRVTFIGAKEARGDLGNLTLLLEPTVRIEGTAPAGALLAIEAKPFPRLLRADANGTFAIEEAPATPAWLVAALPVPVAQRVTAPASNVTLEPGATSAAWRLDGRLVDEKGAPLAGDVVAWNGTMLVSAARANASGAFGLPLAPQAADLRVDARTSDGHYGGTLALPLQGPPGTTARVVMRALC